MSEGTTTNTTNYLNPSIVDIIPQHLIQNTYSRLTTQYAPDLCQRWVEDAQPSKHVFEDLAITALLIELWRMMYGVVPIAEKGERRNSTVSGDSDGNGGGDSFSGFVDVACGNGVLVYVLLAEGYRGWGFDARRRKTWNIFPLSVQECLKEYFYVPKPFADAMIGHGLDTMSDPGVKVHTGTFRKETFVISNHADELTVWTPLMAALACPESPLPFFLIPCCSHSLSGARFRYQPPTVNASDNPITAKLKPKGTDTNREDRGIERDDRPDKTQQSVNGDLKALRAERLASQASATATTATGTDYFNSVYGSLTAKTMNIAEEIGYEVEKSLLQISSTRNMGVVGSRRRVTGEWRGQRARTPQTCTSTTGSNNSIKGSTIQRIADVVSRECAREGGVESAARIWTGRASKRSSHGI